MPRNISSPEGVKHLLPFAYVVSIEPKTPPLCKIRARQEELFTHCKYLDYQSIITGLDKDKPVIKHVYSVINITFCAECPIGRDFVKSKSPSTLDIRLNLSDNT